MADLNVWRHADFKNVDYQVEDATARDFVAWIGSCTQIKPRLHYTRRDATQLSRMIGFQWNQQDRSHYARRHATSSPELAPVPK